MNINQDLVQVSPGEVLFGRSPLMIQTVLGSCVALTAWHPQLLVGGMCHYLLPDNSESKDRNIYIFGVEAIKKMAREMLNFADFSEYRLGLFGGASILFDEELYAVGRKNTQLAKRWLEENKLTLDYESVGGNMARSLKLNLGTGEIILNSSSMSH